MDAGEVGAILERLGGHYGKEITADMAAAWYQAISRFPATAGQAALDSIILTSRFMPNGTEFLQACQAAARDMIRERGEAQPGGECAACGDGRGWVEVEAGGVRPCETCSPDAFETWRKKWAPQNRSVQARKITPDTRLPGNPVDGIKHIKETLNGI